MNLRQLAIGLGVCGGAAAAAFAYRDAPPPPPALLSLPKPPALASGGASVAPPTVPASAAPANPTTPPRFAEEYDVSTFQKGNIHTHTTWSDGDHPPQDVYAWYRDRGYNFLAITDHNGLTDPATFKLLERKKKFVMITGEEVTMIGAKKQVHVNAICTKRTIGGHHFDTTGEALAWGVAQVKAQGGIALVNHPNWDWALTADDIPRARGARLLEIFSGHPHVHTDGDETHKSHEAIWDAALTAGEELTGVAVDDAHIYGPRAPDNAARPGRAWIQVFAEEANRAAICEALSKGRLYSSSGVTLMRIAVKGDTFSVWVKDADAQVEFIGQGGAPLQSMPGSEAAPATYKLTGSEGYVRARITTPGGKRAWTAAVRLAK